MPHELVHLVFDTAVKNPYHFPPRWLNEGLAVYLSDGYDAGDRSTRRERPAATASSSRSTGWSASSRPRRSGSSWPTRRASARSTSSSATHGQDALVSLIGSYADGRTDDEAFEAAIGMDAAGVQRRVAGATSARQAPCATGRSRRRPARARGLGRSRRATGGGAHGPGRRAGGHDRRPTTPRRRPTASVAGVAGGR